MTGTVVVVGGGASPRGAGLGARVDAADVVIRAANHLEWQSETPEDYGTRTDVVYHVVADGSIVTPPIETWGLLLRERWRPLLDHLTEEVHVFDATTLHDRGRSLVADAPRRYVPARGVAAAIAALRWLRPRRLDLVGYDNLAAGRTMASGHRPLNPETITRRFVGAWDPVTDRAVVDAVAIETDTGVCLMKTGPVP